MHRKRLLVLGAVVLMACTALSLGLIQARDGSTTPNGARQADPDRRAHACALLDDPSFRGKISYGYEMRLLTECGRVSKSTTQHITAPSLPPELLPPSSDRLVNNPAGDTGSLATTQSETALAFRASDGRLCAGWNDSWHFDQDLHDSLSGFGYSTDGGVTWIDGGRVPPISGQQNLGDPDVDFRGADGRFYYLTLDTSGIAIHSSTSCTSFPNHQRVVTSFGADKPMMTIGTDGHVYVVYTDFSGSTGDIYLSHSTKPLQNWSSAQQLSVTNLFNGAQGAWPAVGPDGLYVIWVRWNPFPSAFKFELVRVTIDHFGNLTITPRTSPVTSGIVPSDAVASDAGHCNRPALNGFVRVAPFPQMTFFGNALHVVYARDPDGYNTGDASNIYYRRSTDNGVTWQSEVLLSEGGGTKDQIFPTMVGGANGVLAVYWYDRRNDPSNLTFLVYKRVSVDYGVTWSPSESVSDVASPIPPLLPNFDPQASQCYMGDYNESDASSTKLFGIWSDNRNTQNGHPDPDVWFDTLNSAPQCGPCQVSFCQGGGFKCQFNDTCGAGGCCNYTCGIPDPACDLPDPCPGTACNCS